MRGAYISKSALRSIIDDIEALTFGLEVGSGWVLPIASCGKYLKGANNSHCIQRKVPRVFIHKVAILRTRRTKIT
jgi:hypothetical protein